MATKRTRETRDREDKGDSDGIFGSFKRLINNFLFPSYGPATTEATTFVSATPAAPAATAATSFAHSRSPPPLPERSSKRRRIVASEDEASEEEQEMEQIETSEAEPQLSEMSLGELKRRGYSLEEISRIFNNEPIRRPPAASSRYVAPTFTTPRPVSGNGVAANGRTARGATPFVPPTVPRRSAAPVGTYTPSVAPSPSLARRSYGSERWSPAGALKAQLRTPTASKTNAIPRATPSTLAARRHVSVRKTPAPSHDALGEDTTSATAHRILATLGKIPSPLPGDKLSDGRSMQKVLGKRYLDTPSASRDVENGHGVPTGRRPSAKPQPIAKRQRVDEISYVSAPKASHRDNDYYEQEEEDHAEHQDLSHEEDLQRSHEHEEHPAPAKSLVPADKKPSSLPSQPESTAASSSSFFVSPIAASESIFSFQATVAPVTDGADKEESELALTKKKDQKKDKANEEASKKDEPFAKADTTFSLSSNGSDSNDAKKDQPAAPFTVSPFGLSSSPATASTSSFFSLGSSSSSSSDEAPATSSIGFTMPSEDGSKSNDKKKKKRKDASPAKADFSVTSGFSFGAKSDATSSDSGFKSDFSSFGSSASSSITVAPVSFGGFSIPIASAPAAPTSGWKCQCCESDNAESDATCSTCLVPRPTPKAKPAEATPAASASTEPEKKKEDKTPVSLFGGFQPVSTDSTKTETGLGFSAPSLSAPLSFGLAEPKEVAKPGKEDGNENNDKGKKETPAPFTAVEKPKEGTKPATDLFGGFTSPSAFGASSASAFSLTPSTSSTSLSSLSSSAGSEASTSSATTSFFAPSASTTAPAQPFVFGQDKAKEEPKKEAAAASSTPFGFGFGSSAFSAAAPAKEEDTMADSSEPSATASSAASSAPFGSTSFGASAATSTPAFAFGAPTETPLLSSSSSAPGMFMFGASTPAAAPAPAASALTASGSYPFGAPQSAASSSAFSAPTASSVFSSPSSSFSAFGSSSTGGVDAPFGSSAFGATQAAPSTSVFGATTAPSPFGTTAPSPFGSGPSAAAPFGGFGSQSTGASSLTSSGTFGGSAFSAAAPSAAPSPFGASPFGATSAPSPFGASAAPAATSAFAPAPAAAAPAGGGFTLGAAPAAGRRMVRGTRRRGGS